MGSYTPLPSTTLSPGDRLDRYELLCVLAQGGMGTVWLARLSGKLGFEKLVAVKTILPSLCEDRKFVDMFIDEARIASRIDHENVARILEIGEDRGSLYYVMELIDGESLRKLQRDMRAANAAMPIAVAMRIVADACAGLHAAHELCAPDGTPLEVVHRDVSPHNFLITVRGTIKLIDFGVAKARERQSEETATGMLKGKVEFMAPEQARGEPLDRRADVYSVGAILYELLANRPLRDTSEGQMQALHQVMTNQPYAPLPATIPHVVRSVVQRALANDPDQRFQTADELRRAIEHAMLATGISATTEDVAALLVTYSHARMTRKKEAIEYALRNAGIRATAPPEREVTPPPAPVPTPRMPSAPISAPASGPLPPASSPYPPVPPSHGDGPATGPSIRSVGGASVTTAPDDAQGTARMLGAALVICLVALLGVVAGVVATRRHDDPWGGLTPVPQPPIVVASPAPPPEPIPDLAVDASAVVAPPEPAPPRPQPVVTRVASPPPPPPPRPTATAKGPTRIGTIVEAPDDDDPFE